MSIARFNKIVNSSKLSLKYYNEVPLRSIFKPFCRNKYTKEFAVKMVVSVLEKIDSEE
jgi:hypothetical protein